MFTHTTAEVLGVSEFLEFEGDDEGSQHEDEREKRGVGLGEGAIISRFHHFVSRVAPNDGVVTIKDGIVAAVKQWPVMHQQIIIIIIFISSKRHIKILQIVHKNCRYIQR